LAHTFTIPGELAAGFQAPERKERIMKFNAYYYSPEHGEYLRELVADAGIGSVQLVKDLPPLASEDDTDVVLVEYQANNPHLDSWIAQTAEKPRSPEIFIFVDELSPQVLWKAIKLGVREIFSQAIPPEDLQNALTRAGMRHARFKGQDLCKRAWSWFPEPMFGCESCCGM
jgi:hypothetical protein